MPNSFARTDKHAPVNFKPENYSFVGAYHNGYAFGGARDSKREMLRLLLGKNWRPNGPGDNHCDHCGAAIAFVGVFQHVDGEYIAVGSTCADNRFPLANAEFQMLRKAHRLARARDLKRVEFTTFQGTHPEVDWAMAAKLAEQNGTIRSILADGMRYGSLFDYKLAQLVRLTTPVAALTGNLVPGSNGGQVTSVITVTPEEQAAYDYLRAYTGSSTFLNSLKGQLESKGSLSAKQVACVAKNLPAPGASTPAISTNQDVLPGIYVTSDGAIWKVQPNAAYKAAVKQGRDPQADSSCRVYAKVWRNADGSDVVLADAKDASQTQSWVYVPGAISRLAIDHKMTLEEARRFIALFNQCVRCGRKLEAQKSIDAGIGPVCIRYFQAWGEFTGGDVVGGVVATTTLAEAEASVAAVRATAEEYGDTDIMVEIICLN